MGATGEYADYSDWMVCAYTTKDAAEKHAQAAQNWWIENRDVWDSDDWWDKDVHNPYDSYGCRPDYTGTEYHAFEIDLKTEFVPVA